MKTRLNLFEKEEESDRFLEPNSRSTSNNDKQILCRFWDTNSGDDFWGKSFFFIKNFHIRVNIMAT